MGVQVSPSAPSWFLAVPSAIDEPSPSSLPGCAAPSRVRPLPPCPAGALNDLEQPLPCLASLCPPQDPAPGAEGDRRRGAALYPGGRRDAARRHLLLVVHDPRLPPPPPGARNPPPSRRALPRAAGRPDPRPRRPPDTGASPYPP